jgi:hypothetical protein
VHLTVDRVGARWRFAEVGEMNFLLGSDQQRDLVLALKL